MNLNSGIQEYTNLDSKVVFKEGISRNKNEICLSVRNKILFSILCLKELCINKPDIVNTHGGWYMNLPAIIYKCFRPKTCIIQTHHTDPGALLKGIKKYYYERILSIYDYNVFVSNYLMERYSYYNIKSEKKVIYGAVDIIKTKIEDIAKFKEKFGITDKDEIITYIGNFAWDLKSKGVNLLIKSMPEVISKNKKAKLLIIGKGKYQERSIILAEKLGLEKKVIFTNNLTDVYSPLKISKIYVHITYQDSFANSILEAISAKTPVIASDFGPIKEIIENDKTGIIVQNNIKSISKGIIKLLNDKKKREKISNNAYMQVKRRFNWEKSVSQYMELIEEYERRN
jgi:glycosyltransferase involved in cell wall biosynthesis